MSLLSRRRFGGLALAGTAGLILPAPFLGRARAQAREGGTLTVALYKDLRTLNPIKGIFGNEWRVGINLYDNLTRLRELRGLRGREGLHLQAAPQRQVP
jgi:hypothetical protein